MSLTHERAAENVDAGGPSERTSRQRRSLMFVVLCLVLLGLAAVFATRQMQMHDEIIELRASLEEVTRSVPEDASSEISDLESQYFDLSSQVEELSSRVDDMGYGFDDLSSQVDSVDSKVDEISSCLNFAYLFGIDRLSACP